MLKKKVAIVMGSSSDAAIMLPAASFLEKAGIEYDFLVVSAHRSPQWLFEYAGGIEQENIGVVIAGAGGAAHLPGMMAALTSVPVIGVPIKSSNSIDGWDSLLSIVQMPNDVPVATVAINSAHNAGVLAAQILGVYDDSIKQFLLQLKIANQQKVQDQNKTLKSR